MSKRTDLTQAIVLCNTRIINTNLLIPEEASIRRGTRLDKTADRPGASSNYSTPSSYSKTSLSSASPLEWSTSLHLGGVCERGEGGPLL